jgi:hypothetical protein
MLVFWDGNFPLSTTSEAMRVAFDPIFLAR